MPTSLLNLNTPDGSFSELALREVVKDGILHQSEVTTLRHQTVGEQNSALF